MENDDLKIWENLVNVDLVKRTVKDTSQSPRSVVGSNFSENDSNFTMHEKHYSNHPSQFSSHSSTYKYFIWI